MGLLIKTPVYNIKWIKMSIKAMGNYKDQKKSGWSCFQLYALQTFLKAAFSDFGIMLNYRIRKLGFLLSRKLVNNGGRKNKLRLKGLKMVQRNWRTFGVWLIDRWLAMMIINDCLVIRRYLWRKANRLIHRKKKLERSRSYSEFKQEAVLSPNKKLF